MNQQMRSYGKLSSASYGVWFPEKNEDYEDTDFYRKYIKEGQGPALEVGCGDGRILVPLASEGFDIEGVDLSLHMIEQCRKKAEKKGIKIKLHHQAMQDLNITKRYSTIFIPYGSFMLVNIVAEAQRAIQGFYNHLLPGGTLIIPLFIPTAADIHVSAPIENEWRLRREGKLPDGSEIKCWEKASFDLKAQVENSEYRYEVTKNGKIIETEEENLTLKWYQQQEFAAMLTQTGFKNIQCFNGYTEALAGPNDMEFTFVASK